MLVHPLAHFLFLLILINGQKEKLRIHIYFARQHLNRTVVRAIFTLITIFIIKISIIIISIMLFLSLLLILHMSLRLLP
jgi:hypothetical protein